MSEVWIKQPIALDFNITKKKSNGKCLRMKNGALIKVGVLIQTYKLIKKIKYT